MLDDIFTIRTANAHDIVPVAALAHALWPDSCIRELEAEFAALFGSAQACVFAACAGEEIAGFAQCQLRYDYVEGCDSTPVGYLEGIYVAPEHRKRGLASALIARCEGWAKRKGCRQFASDCELDNEDSLRFHLKAGFSEANRIICFTKDIGGAMEGIVMTGWDDRFAGDYITMSVDWLKEYGLLEPADLEILEHPHEAVLNGGGQIFFALCGGAPVGTASVINMGGGVYEIAKLTVLYQYRGRGIAKALMTACLDFARSSGAVRAVLYTNHKLTAALGLYKHMGFIEVKHEHSPYVESDIRMELELC